MRSLRGDGAGLKSQAAKLAAFLLALSFLCCSALRKNAPGGDLSKTSKGPPAAHLKLPHRGISAKERPPWLNPRSLNELYDQFAAEVDYEIRRGLAEKDQKRVLLGLQNLRRFLPAADAAPALSRDSKEAVMIGHVRRLVSRHLTVFAEREASREDYWRLAADYKALAGRAFEYYTSSARQNPALKDLVERKSQMAGAGVISATIALVAGIPFLVWYFGYVGVTEQKLDYAIIVLKKQRQKICQAGPPPFSPDAWDKRFNKFSGFDECAGEAETALCSLDPEMTGCFEDRFGSAGHRWDRGRQCESIGAPSPSAKDCDFRKWMCKNIRIIKRCLRAANM